MHEDISYKKMMLMVLMTGLFFMPVGSLATVVQIYPSDDTYVDEFNPSGNYGGAVVLNVGIKDITGPAARCRTYLLFDLSAIPSDATINSAELVMEVTSYTNPSPPSQVAVHHVDDHSWDEMSLTWSMPPNVPAIFHPTPADTTQIWGAGVYSWTVTNGVIAAHGTDGRYSAVVKLLDDKWIDEKNDFIQFRASDSDVPPKLVIDYTSPALEPPELIQTGVVVTIAEEYEFEAGYIYVEADPDDGNIDNTSTVELDESSFILYYEHEDDKVFRILEPNQLGVIAEFDYDILGRLQLSSCLPYSFPSAIRSDSTALRTELSLDYDVLGNVCAAEVSYCDGSCLCWSLAPDQNDNLFKGVFEKKDNTSGTASYTGEVNYFPHDPDGILEKSIQGHTGAAEKYLYDLQYRLQSIARNTGSTLWQYQYNSTGQLDQYYSFENRDYSSKLYYTLDPVNLRPTFIASETNNSDPDYVYLGRFNLSSYSPLATPTVGYSSDETATAPIPTIFSIKNIFDKDGRLIRRYFKSFDSDVPSLSITFDPNIPNRSEYTLTKYIYDRKGRRVWEVDINGNVTRILYHQTCGLEHKAMLQFHTPEPNEINISKFEYDDSTAPIRSTDLMGHFTKYNYDSAQNLTNTFIFGIHGGGGSGGGLGQVFEMFANPKLGVPPEPWYPRYEWDQYGNFGVIINEKELTPDGTEADAQTNLTVPGIKISRNTRNFQGQPLKQQRIGCRELVIGDHNGDCLVNLIDWALFAAHWLEDKRM
ncbi:MAG: hypothetical protein AMJ79_08185 [Phycisphaerae bacterium SM23_30]|nr:MAG: hypothetical protein AMJ79_08185 [Phycisphaerae bacterium SM23_30]